MEGKVRYLVQYLIQVAPNHPFRSFQVPKLPNDATHDTDHADHATCMHLGSHAARSTAAQQHAKY